MSGVPILSDVRNAGFVGLILLFMAVVGLLLSALSVGFAASKQRSAFAVGITTLVFAAMISFVGALGTMYGRHITDQALETLVPSKVLAEKIRRVGYEESRSASKLALMFVVLPLLTGALAAFTGARRRKPEAASTPYAAPSQVPSNEGEGGSASIAAFIALSVDLLGIAGATALMMAPLPGRNWAEDDPTWDLAGAVEGVLEPPPASPVPMPWEESEPGKKEDPCRRLGQSLDPEAHEQPRREDVPGLSEAASKCVAERLAAVAKLETNAEKRRELEALEKSPLVIDDETRQKVKAALEGLPKDEPSPAPAAGLAEPTLGTTTGKATVRMGATSVSGRLPPEVIQRIVRQNFGRFRLCYEQGLKTSPSLQGTVSVRFVIDREGHVSAATGQSDDLDNATVACVLRAFKSLSFPSPEGGIVTVTYPIRFSPG